MKLANPEPLGLNYRHPKYFDKADLEQELDRIYDICHGCRLCFNLCPSFPALFDAIDEHDEEIAGLSWAEKERVVDLCFQCKLCYVKCPYTPPHDYNLDFPRVMLRARAVKTREQGASFTDRMLGMTDLMGRLGSMLAPIMNLSLTNRLNRILMEKVVGIDRRRLLPAYARETFAGWWSRKGGARPKAPRGRVVLFHTCSVNYNDVETGKAAAFVLNRNDVEVEVVKQECCGMPYLDGGMVEKGAELARRNVARLLPLVERGYTVVAPGPTCSYTIKNEWPELLQTDEARKVAANTKDLSEYLMGLKAEGKLSEEFTRRPGKIAYHVPCHLKAQNVGLPSQKLLTLAGADVEVVDRCSGVDGTWGLKHAYYDMSVKVAKKLINKVADEDKEFERVVSDCPLAGLTIEERTKYKPEHPVMALARAYGYEPEER